MAYDPAHGSLWNHGEAATIVRWATARTQREDDLAPEMQTRTTVSYFKATAAALAELNRCLEAPRRLTDFEHRLATLTDLAWTQAPTVPGFALAA